MEALAQTIVLGMVMVAAMVITVGGVSRLRPRAGGGITASGRAVRFVLWRGPTSVTRRFAANQAALLTAEGQRWAALFGFGLWAGVIVAITFLTRVGRPFGAFVGMVWIFFLLRMLQTAHRRRQSMKNRMRFEEIMLQGQVALTNQVRQLLAAANGGGFTMGGSSRHLGDEIDDMQRAEREHVSSLFHSRDKSHKSQSEQVHEWIDDAQGDVPTGEWVRPSDKLPRWLRRMLK